MCAKSHIEHVLIQFGSYKQLQETSIMTRLVFLRYSIDVASAFLESLKAWFFKSTFWHYVKLKEK